MSRPDLLLRAASVPTALLVLLGAGAVGGCSRDPDPGSQPGRAATTPTARHPAWQSPSSRPRAVTFPLMIGKYALAIGHQVDQQTVATRLLQATGEAKVEGNRVTADYAETGEQQPARFAFEFGPDAKLTALSIDGRGEKHNPTARRLVAWLHRRRALPTKVARAGLDAAAYRHAGFELVLVRGQQDGEAVYRLEVRPEK